MNAKELFTLTANLAREGLSPLDVRKDPRVDGLRSPQRALVLAGVWLFAINRHIAAFLKGPQHAQELIAELKSQPLKALPNDARLRQLSVRDKASVLFAAKPMFAYGSLFLLVVFVVSGTSKIGGAVTGNDDSGLVDRTNVATFAGSCHAIGSRLSLYTIHLRQEILNQPYNNQDQFWRLHNFGQTVLDFGRDASVGAKWISQNWRKEVPINEIPTQVNIYSNALIKTTGRFDQVADKAPWKGVAAWNSCASEYGWKTLDLPSYLKKDRAAFKH